MCTGVFIVPNIFIVFNALLWYSAGVLFASSGDSGFPQPWGISASGGQSLWCDSSSPLTTLWYMECGGPHAPIVCRRRWTQHTEAGEANMLGDWLCASVFSCSMHSKEGIILYTCVDVVPDNYTWMCIMNNTTTFECDLYCSLVYLQCNIKMVGAVLG